jgi:hypothetical protein
MSTGGSFDRFENSGPHVRRIELASVDHFREQLLAAHAQVNSSWLACGLLLLDVPRCLLHETPAPLRAF